MEHMRRKTAMHNERTQHIVAIYGFHSIAKSSEIEEKQKLEKAEKYRAHERDNRKDFFHRLGKRKKDDMERAGSSWKNTHYCSSFRIQQQTRFF